MTRARLTLTIDGPPGGASARLLEALRDMGYTVKPPRNVVGTRRVVAEVIAPHGEVSDRRYLDGAGARRLPYFLTSKRGS